MLHTPSDFERAYLAQEDPRAQSGFSATRRAAGASRLGLRPRGGVYRRSDEHLVEVAVAWADQD